MHSNPCGKLEADTLANAARVPCRPLFLQSRVLGAGVILPAQHWEMLDELFRLSSPLIAGTVIGLLGCVSWSSDARSWRWRSLAIALNLVVITYRLLLTLAFKRRGAEEPPERWERRLLAAIVVTGLQWGLSLALIYAGAGPSTQLYVLACMCGFISGAASRAYTFPSATAAQIIIAVALIAIPVFASGHALFAAVVSLFAVAHLFVVHSLCTPKLRLLMAEIEREKLLGLLRVANAELAGANRRLQERAMTDGLTGVANRRHFDQRLAELEAGDDWQVLPHSLIMMDVDRFKAFNDTHGHGAGDRCLALLAQAAAACLTAPEHLLARYGGEEFAIILPRTDAAGAQDLAERIRAAVAGVRVMTREGEAAPTASFGIASTVPGLQEKAFAWVERADQALYRAKQAGRDCVRSADAPLARALSLA